MGAHGRVEVDYNNHIVLASAKDYEKGLKNITGKNVKRYATDLKQRKVKTAFFSSTPQGGGVALMRHSTVRHSHLLGVDTKW